MSNPPKALYSLGMEKSVINVTGASPLPSCYSIPPFHFRDFRTFQLKLKSQTNNIIQFIFLREISFAL